MVPRPFTNITRSSTSRSRSAPRTPRARTSIRARTPTRGEARSRDLYGNGSGSPYQKPVLTSSRTGSAHLPCPAPRSGRGIPSNSPSTPWTRCGLPRRPSARLPPRSSRCARTACRCRCRGRSRRNCRIRRPSPRGLWTPGRDRRHRPPIRIGPPRRPHYARGVFPNLFRGREARASARIQPRFPAPPERTIDRTLRPAHHGT